MRTRTCTLASESTPPRLPHTNRARHVRCLLAAASSRTLHTREAPTLAPSHLTRRQSPSHFTRQPCSLVLYRIVHRSLLSHGRTPCMDTAGRRRRRRRIRTARMANTSHHLRVQSPRSTRVTDGRPPRAWLGGTRAQERWDRYGANIPRPTTPAPPSQCPPLVAVVVAGARQRACGEGRVRGGACARRGCVRLCTRVATGRRRPTRGR